MLVKYNPTNTLHKSTIGALCSDVDCKLTLLLDARVAPTKVWLHIIEDKNNISNEYQLTQDIVIDGMDSYVLSVNFPKGLYWYYFRLEGVSYEQYIGVGADLEASMYYDSVKPWQLSVYDAKYATPQWLNDGVMYQIMVDRFCHKGKVVPTEDKQMRVWGQDPYYQEPDGSVTNRDFFGGTLAGITSKLGYLQSLGVTTLYLNPIFSAYSNHKYDTENYESIDSMFGTKKDFDTLVAKAKDKGMHIILDGVFNHVGVDSVYFNKSGKQGDNVGAYQDKQSYMREWFGFRPDGSYESWWNFDTLPRINGNVPSAQQYFCGEKGIVPYWIGEGISGWRLDVVDEICDSMLDKITSSAKEAMSDSAIIGEVWEDASNKMAYGERRRYFEGAQLDSVMNYPLKDSIIEFVRYGNVFSLKYAIFNILNNYPLHVRNNLMNILGTHDTKRIVTALAGDVSDHCSRVQLSKMQLTEAQHLTGVKLLQLAVVLQYTLFGFPSVYYGDEAGLEGYRDPFCRRCYPWGRENRQLLDFYTRMGQLRKMPVFADGDFFLVHADSSVVVYNRSLDDSHVVVSVNRSSFSFCITLDGKYVDYLTGREHSGSADIQPDQAMILIRQ